MYAQVCRAFVLVCGCNPHTFCGYKQRIHSCHFAHLLQWWQGRLSTLGREEFPPPPPPPWLIVQGGTGRSQMPNRSGIFSSTCALRDQWHKLYQLSLSSRSLNGLYTVASIWWVVLHRFHSALVRSRPGFCSAGCAQILASLTEAFTC